MNRLLAEAAAIAGAIARGRDLEGVMDKGTRASLEGGAAVRAVAQGGPDLGSLFTDHELMTYHQLEYERDALVAELMRRFTLQDQ